MGDVRFPPRPGHGPGGANAPRGAARRRARPGAAPGPGSPGRRLRVTTPRPPAVRGPTGAAPPPPAWLGRTSVPIDRLPGGTVLHRIHRTSLAPVFFGP